jgi:lysophospholipase L1-like esterase
MSRLITALVISVVLVLLAAACMSPFQGNLSGPRVAILSNSLLTDPTGAHLEYFLGDTHQTSRLAIPGARSYDMVEAARDWANAVDVAVISLGTNDAVAITSEGRTVGYTYDNGYTPIRDAFSNASCIVFLTLDEQMPSIRAGVNEELNRWWRIHALYWPDRYLLADWNAAINYFGGYPAMTIDGIHPNAFGSQIMAEIIEDQVNRCPTP